MAHKHSVYDTDLHFIIDPITRKISSESGKVILVQNDHNSERFTFEVPRYVEGHDMSLCNQVQVHYINTDSANKKNQSIDIYPVDDLQISPDSDDVVICSWLVSQNATIYAGTLSFIVRYACVADDGTIDYQWFTEICTTISIAKSIYNTEVVTEDADPDVLFMWKQEIMAMVEPQVERAETAAENAEASAAAAKESEENAALSESRARVSEMNALLSEKNAKTSETNAKASEEAAALSENNAATSEANAKASEEAAALSEFNAKESEKAAKASEVNAQDSEECAAKSAEIASNAAAAAACSANTAAKSAENLLESEYNAKRSELNAKNSELMSQSYAVGGTGVRLGEDTDNSKYYSEVASNLYNEALTALDEAETTLAEANKKLTETEFSVNLETGYLEYTSPNYEFTIDTTTGNLIWGVI